MSRRKPVHGPPAPNMLLLRIEDQLRSDDPVDVIEAALKMREARGGILPMGGGLLIGDKARRHAEDIFGALRRRGLIQPTQLRLEELARP